MNSNSKESEPPVQSPAKVPMQTGPPQHDEPPTESPVEVVPRDRQRPRARLGRVWAARFVAMAADALQLALIPLFMGGAVSPFDGAIDIATGLVLTWLVGWHWAFLPTFIAELVPFVDLVPSWTLAAFIATRGHTGDEERAPRRENRQP